MPIDHFPFSANGGGVYQPWLSMRIITPPKGLSLTTYGLVDTGADECAVSTDSKFKGGMLSFWTQNVREVMV